MRSVTLPQVLLVLGLLAGVILASRFAPGVATDVIALVSIAIAYVVPSPLKSAPKDPPDAGPLALVFLAVVIGASVVISGCDAFTGKYAGQDKLEDEVARHSDQIETCKQKARLARADEDASPDDALAVFDRCMAGVDGGVK